MADNMTGRTQVPAEVNYAYDRELLERTTPYLPHAKFAQVRPIKSGAGTDTAEFRRYGNLTAVTTALTPGVTPEAHQLSTTEVTATVEYYGAYVTLVDEVLIESPDPVLLETAGVLGDHAALSLDTLTRNILAATTNIQYASTATANDEITTAMRMTRDETREAVRTLEGADAKPITRMVDASNRFNTTPLNACFVGIVDSNTVIDLEDADGWVPVEKYSDKSDVMPGEVGKINRVRFVSTSNGYVNEDAGSGSIDVYYSLILAKDAYGITQISGHALENIVTPLGAGASSDPLRQRATSGWKASFVAVILDQTKLVCVRHAVRP